MTLAKSAWTGPAFAFSPSLVQAMVQAAEGGGATVVVASLTTGAPLPVTLEAEGSSPFTLAFLESPAQILLIDFPPRNGDAGSPSL